MRKWTCVLAALGLLVLFVVGQRGEGQQPDNVRTMMQLKLSHAQSILDGLATEDFEKVEKNAQKLALVSQAAAWQVLQTPEYARQSAEFRRTADDLAKHAKEKNLDAAALDYVKLTLNCINCHKYVRGERVAQVEQPNPFLFGQVK